MNLKKKITINFLTDWHHKVVWAFYILDLALVFNRENSINQSGFILVVKEHVNKLNKVKRYNDY